MDSKESLIVARRSWNSLLFLIPQAARNVREALRSARASVRDDAPAEEKALFAQQEALLGKLYKAIGVMSRDGWEFADERLQKLIAECEELRAKLDCEGKELAQQEFHNRLVGLVPAPEDAKARAQRLARLIADDPISSAPDGPGKTSAVGEGQNGEGK